MVTCCFCLEPLLGSRSSQVPCPAARGRVPGARPCVPAPEVGGKRPSQHAVVAGSVQVPGDLDAEPGWFARQGQTTAGPSALSPGASPSRTPSPVTPRVCSPVAASVVAEPGGASGKGPGCGEAAQARGQGGQLGEQHPPPGISPKRASCPEDLVP